MSHEHALSLIAILSFFAILVALSFVRASDQRGQQYLIGGRRIGLFSTAAALVAGFRDGAGLSAWVALAILFGFGSLWLWVGMALALAGVSLLAGHVRRQGDETGAYSLSGWLGLRLGESTGKIAAVVVGLTAFLYAGAQFAVAANIAAAVFDVGGVVAVAAIVVVISTYIALGGYLSIIRTDVFQWVIITALLIGLPYMLSGGAPALPTAQTFMAMDPALAVGFAAISFLVILSGGDTWQRVLSARTSSVASSAALLAAAMYLAISIGLVVLGHNIGLSFPDLPAEGAFQAMFGELETIGYVWTGLGLLVAASAISTIDTQVYLFSSALVPAAWPKSTPERQAKLVRYASVGFALATGCLALAVGNVVEFLFAAVTLGTTLAPLVIVAALSRKPLSLDRVAAPSLLIGGAVYAVMFARGDFANILLTPVPAIVVAATLAGGLVAQRMFGRPTL